MKTILILTLSAALFGATKLPEPSPTVSPAPIGSKSVLYSEKDIIHISTQLRFTTLIVLPKGEEILDFVTGDKDFWTISGTQNFAMVKPAKAGAQTNLNLITAAGNVYSFTLAEGSGTPDLKVFVELRDELLTSALNAAPRFVPAHAVDDYRQQAEIARLAQRRAEEESVRRIADIEKRTAAERDRAAELHSAAMRVDYKFKRDPIFAVTAIYRDDKFTYIQARPNETPTVYEMRDGKPSLIDFAYKDGLFTLPKIVTSGYLEIGKKRLQFDEVQR